MRSCPLSGSPICVVYMYVSYEHFYHKLPIKYQTANDTFLYKVHWIVFYSFCFNTLVCSSLPIYYHFISLRQKHSGPPKAGFRVYKITGNCCRWSLFSLSGSEVAQSSLSYANQSQYLLLSWPSLLALQQRMTHENRKNVPGIVIQTNLIVK